MASNSEEKDRLVSNAKVEKLKQIANEHIMVEIKWSVPNKLGLRSRTKIKSHVKRTFSNADRLSRRFIKTINEGTYDKTANEAEGTTCTGSCKNHGNWISWFWLCIILFCTTLIIIGRIEFPDDRGYWLLLFPIAVTWILYSFEWNFIADTPDHLERVISKDNAIEYLDKLHKIQAVIVWKSKSFHYQLNKKHQRTKITTYQKKKKFAFQTRDKSIDCELNEFELTKLHLFKTWKFANDKTKDQYEKQFNAFCDEHHKAGRNECQHVDVTLELQGFECRKLVNGVTGTQAIYCTNVWYKIISWLFCSPCYRTVFNAKSGVESHIILKEISLPLKEIPIEEDDIYL